MSQSISCSLCANICNDFKSLYDENDHCNEIYEITIKYFNPLFFDIRRSKHFKHICLQCWHHIDDFHTFQNSVIVAQTKLLKYEVESNVDQTSEIYNEQLLVGIKSDIGNLPHVKEEEEEALPDSELFDTQRNSQFKCKDDKDAKRTETVSKITQNIGISDENNINQAIEIFNDKPLVSLKSEEENLPKECHTFQTREVKVENEFLPEFELKDTQRDNHFQIENDLICENKTETFDENTSGSLCGSVKSASLEECQDRVGVFDEVDSSDEYEETWWEEMNENVDMEFDGERFDNTTNDSMLSKKHDDLSKDMSTRIHKCAYCPKTFTYHANLYRHIKTAHSKEAAKNLPIAGAKCDAARTSSAGFTRTVEIEDVSKCSLCPKAFKYKSTLNYHFKRQHWKERAEKILSQPKLTNNKKDIDDINLKCQSRYYFNSRKPEESHIVKATHRCPHCSMTFKYPSTLLYHNKSAHSTDNDKSKYKCNKCYEAFKILSEFREHVTDHNGGDIQKCKDCPKTFSFLSSMYEHKTGTRAKEKSDGKILSQSISSVIAKSKYKSSSDSRGHLDTLSAGNQAEKDEYQKNICSFYGLRTRPDKNMVI